MDKLNINVVDASQAAEGVTTHVLGIADDGSLKKVEVTPSLSDTYSRETIDSKDAANKAYTDQQISELIGGATPEQLDTLKELGDALTQSGDAIVAINGELSKKYGTDNKPTPTDVGLGNVTNERQMRADAGRVTTQDWNALTYSGGNTVSNASGLNTPTGAYGYGTLLNVGPDDSPNRAQIYFPHNALNPDTTYHMPRFRSSFNSTDSSSWKTLATTEYISAAGYYNPSNKPTAADIGAAATGHTHEHLVAQDSRDVKPNMLRTKAMELIFAKGSTFGTGVAYVDVLSLNSYQDNSGGVTNALVASKSTNELWHVQGAFQGESWSPPAKIYTSSSKPTASELGALPITGGTLTGPIVMAYNSRLDGHNHVGRYGGTANSYTHYYDNVAGPLTHHDFRFANGRGGYTPYQMNGTGAFSSTEGRFYSQGFKPTPAEIGALPITGGNLTGPLTTVGNSVSYRGLTVHNSSDGWSYMALHSKGTEAHIAHTNKSESGAAANSLHLRPMGGQNGSLMLQPNAPMIHLTSFGNITIGSANTEWAHFNTDRPKFHFGKPIAVLGEIYAGGSYNQRVYHQGFKPTPAEIGALSYNSSTLNGNDATVAYGRQGLQVSNLSGTGGNGTNGVYLSNPTNDWYYHLTQNHANNGGYYFDIASSFHSDSIYFRRMANGSASDWCQLYHTKFKPTAAELGVYTKSEVDASQRGTMKAPIDLGTEHLDNLGVGVYAQHANVNTSLARGYPEELAGGLIVTAGAGLQQRYHIYSTTRVYVRSKYTGSWTAWAREYNTQNKPTAADIGAQPAGSYAASSHRHPWSDLDGVPATASRWPNKAEVGLGNVGNYTSSTGAYANTHVLRDGNGDLVARQLHGTHVGEGSNLYNLQWARLVGVPATASRWPTWAEIGGKPPSIGSDTGWINVPMTAKTGTSHVIGNRKTMRYRVLNGIIYFDFQIIFLDAKTTVAYTRLPNWHYGEKYIAGTGSGDRGGGSESKLFKITAAGDIYNAVDGVNQYHVVTGLNPTPVD